MFRLQRGTLPVTVALVATVGLTLAAVGKDADGVVWPDASGFAHISGGDPQAPIELRVSRRMAGAIDSLTWGGRQFVNANDHGREFQSAAYFDRKGGCLNPTEAGSISDGIGPESTSELLWLNVGAASLTTRTRMAYWLGPGEQVPECHGTRSAVTTLISDDLVTKTVRIGSEGVASAISYDVTFTVAEPHSYAIFEALTGYMPPEFRNFWMFEPARNLLTRQSNEQGAQSLPLIVSTDDGRFALGVVYAGPRRPTYGRWDFTRLGMASPTLKWNSVFAQDSVEPGDYHFAMRIVVGTLASVQSDLRILCARLDPGRCA